MQICCRTFEILLQNFCRICRNFGTFKLFGTFKTFGTFEDFLQNFCRTLEFWKSQEFKLNKSWLSIDQSVGKCIKSIKLEKIWETDSLKKRTLRAFAYVSWKFKFIMNYQRSGPFKTRNSFQVFQSYISIFVFTYFT